GLRVVSWWLPGHGGRAPGGAERALAELDRLVAATEPSFVGGLSYGAHLAARWAARGGSRATQLCGLLLLLPAWTGPAGGTAGATAATADAIARRGLPAAMADVAATAPGWIGDAVVRAWRHHEGPALVAALREAAESPGPTLAELAAINTPAAVVSLAGDPLHPADVGREWARTLPNGRFAEVAASGPADLGRAACALTIGQASGSSASNS
ncbi:MAG: alpha/beta fold hydrolase, partial [Mycobacteriales bacterium]